MRDEGEAPKVYVVVVNWNGADDTIACLESLRNCDHPRFEVIVCDNGSADDSVVRLREWTAREELPVELIEIGENRGFAAGGNVGIGRALERGDVDYVWLLNNDATAAPPALSALVAELERRPAAGFCGSTVCFADGSGRVQAMGGGSYDPWFSRTRLFARDAVPEPAEQEAVAVRVRRELDFVAGASLLVSRAVLDHVGPMTEDYFLYYEEIDWARRARGRYELTWAPASLVHHRVGASIGSSAEEGGQSLLADYWGLRNRILFTKRYHPLCLPTIYASLFVSALRRLTRGQPERIGMIARLALWGVGLGHEARIRARYLGARPQR